MVQTSCRAQSPPHLAFHSWNEALLVRVSRLACANHLLAFCTGIRSLIGEVVVAPGESRGAVKATLRGELIAILDLPRASIISRPPRPEL